MIYTCTISPSIDYTVFVPEFKSGNLNRSEQVHYYPGGKGINVSRVLKRLGVSSRALGFTGGFTGQYIHAFLTNEDIATDFIETDDITRINVKIKSHTETELNGPGPTLTEEQLSMLTAKVRAMQQGDWFVLSGSMPRSVPTDFMMELATLCNTNGVRFVVDTSGPALKQLLSAPVFLVKPNQHELGELFGVEITSIADAYRYAQQLVKSGTTYVVVSLGSEGALLVSKELALRAKPPKGQVVNTVGSGDSLVAGFIASYAHSADAITAFRTAVASGSATAFRSDLCEEEDVFRLLEQVEIYPFEEKDVTT